MKSLHRTICVYNYKVMYILSNDSYAQCLILQIQILSIQRQSLDYSVKYPTAFRRYFLIFAFFTVH